MTTSRNLAALERWRAEVESRPDVPLWVVRTDSLVSVVYTVDADLEDVAMARALYADRYNWAKRPSSREGVTRIDVTPKVDRFVADEDTARTVARILAHNRVHGTLRMAGDRDGDTEEGF